MRAVPGMAPICNLAHGRNSEPGCPPRFHEDRNSYESLLGVPQIFASCSNKYQAVDRIIFFLRRMGEKTFAWNIQPTRSQWNGGSREIIRRRKVEWLKNLKQNLILRPCVV